MVGPEKQGYSDVDLAAAVRDVEEQQATLREAARRHSIPLTTLQRHVKRPDVGTSKARPKALSDTAEQLLVSWIRAKRLVQHTCTIEHIKLKAAELQRIEADFENKQPLWPQGLFCKYRVNCAPSLQT